MESLSSKLKVHNNIKPLVIGHRGASRYFPENTMRSFKAAFDYGADMIELDVLLSADKVPVVIHDLNLARTTDGDGLVSEYSLTDLKKLDAGSWFSSAFRQERIPTLNEVLTFARGRIDVNIEIKHEAVENNLKEGVVEKVVEVVENTKMASGVIVSSFDYRVMDQMNSLNPEIPTAILYEKKQSGKLQPSGLLKRYKASALNCTASQFRRNWIMDAAENNIPIFVYTVNRKGRMQSLIRKGVRGIFTDRPDLMRRVVDKMWESK